MAHDHRCHDHEENRHDEGTRHQHTHGLVDPTIVTTQRGMALRQI